jgi:uncharacterized protein
MTCVVRNLTRGTVLAEVAEVADTSAKRRRGLLGRDGLAKGEGLLISPCEGIHTFAMRFAIDVVFLNARKQVVKLRPEMGARRIAFCLRAAAVLELPAGTLAATGTAPGDQLEIAKLPAE